MSPILFTFSPTERFVYWPRVKADNGVTMGRLEGKRALITGSASGIGRAAAKLFAKEGARLTLCDIKLEENNELAEEIRSTGGEALPIHTDVGDPEAMQTAFERSIKAFDGLDVIYNNAGGATANDGRITEIDLEEFWHAIRLNLFGTVLGCRYGIPHLVASGGGSVINTASIR
ncbi:MAG: SDR family NAD(P)-dependent oxidoreductase, partial [Alphaproteobacteria bacterium]